MHYKTRAQCLHGIGGGGLVGSCFGVRYCFVRYCLYLGGGGFSHFGKSSGCTRLRLWCAKLL